MGIIWNYKLTRKGFTAIWEHAKVHCSPIFKNKSGSINDVPCNIVPIRATVSNVPVSFILWHFKCRKRKCRFSKLV